MTSRKRVKGMDEADEETEMLTQKKETRAAARGPQTGRDHIEMLLDEALGQTFPASDPAPGAFLGLWISEDRGGAARPTRSISRGLFDAS
jgi:hypothetical protein